MRAGALGATWLAGCGGEPTRPEPPRFVYTVHFADGRQARYEEPRATFVAYDAGGEPASWVAEYWLGDSLTVFEFLPEPAECPAPRSLIATTTALDGTTQAAVGWQHEDLADAYALDSTSRVVLDSVRAGRVWGRLSLRLLGHDTSRFPALLTGTFELEERERYGIAPHCSADGA